MLGPHMGAKPRLHAPGAVALELNNGNTSLCIE